MDTSGIIAYALTKQALCALQIYFKQKDNIKKVYEALVCGFLNADGGEIDLPLESNMNCLPFVCVGTENKNSTSLKKNKLKESLTYFEVIQREYYHGYPVTRVKLIPYTGR